MTAALIILSVLALLALIVVLFDAVPLFLNWEERIGIGRMSGEAWLGAVKNTALKWLKKTPSVPITDNTRLTLIDRLRGNYRSDKIQSWQEAFLLLGLNECGNDEGTKKEIKEYVDRVLSESADKLPMSVDFALKAYAVLTSPLCDREKMRPLFDSVFDFLKKSAGDGTVPYNVNIPNVRFVDAVGMVCPFLFEYAAVYGSDEASALALRQIDEYVKYGLHSCLYVPVHCFNTANKAPLGVYGWGRGCGWFAFALYASLGSTAGETKAHISEIAEKFADGMIKYQLPSGGWGRMIFSDSVGESSATAMTACLMNGLFLESGDEKYKNSFDKAISFLQKSTRRNGKVDFAQGDTKGIGFYSSRLGVLPAAQGASLVAACKAHTNKK
ncbi:MAG: glycoside hydrolase family 88 protein [Clostridiales bacterium]|nr:glycoside hydrolase family 88 protein [Clostridiales bacterium]